MELFLMIVTITFILVILIIVITKPSDEFLIETFKNCVNEIEYINNKK